MDRICGRGRFEPFRICFVATSGTLCAGALGEKRQAENNIATNGAPTAPANKRALLRCCAFPLFSCESVTIECVMCLTFYARRQLTKTGVVPVTAWHLSLQGCTTTQLIVGIYH